MQSARRTITSGNRVREVDLYGGFNKNISNLYEENEDEAYQNALKVSSYGKRNSTPKTNWIGERLRTGEVPSTAMARARPSTAVRPVGFSSDTLMFDPFNQASKKAVAIENKKEDTPEQKYKNIEKKIFDLLEESILASTGLKPDVIAGLAKAKEASSMDRTLLRMRNQNGGNFTHNFDLTYSVLFNLANLYYKNEMFIEALNTYTLMTKNKMFPNVNRLKINMGNIYFQLGLFSKAIKMYRMALDQVPGNQKELRLKITHNIAILFAKMGQYSDAATSFEFIMAEKGDVKSGLHLVLCYYALGDTEKMKKAFQYLLDVPIDYNDEEKLINSGTNPSYEYVYNAIQSDELYKYEQKLKNQAQRSILVTVNLISSVIENNFNDGYTWCVETIKYSGFSKLATELEINKALIFLKLDDVNQAIDALKFFEKKDSNVAVNAAINLTFIYLLKRDLETAEKYAETARKLDSYNPHAFVNSGVCEMMKEKSDVAKFMFNSALEIDATLFEAIYNMGEFCLVNKKTGDYDEALNYFHKLNANLGHQQHPEIMFQIGNVYELMGDFSAALEWYHQLLGIVQSDAGVLKKIGELYETKNERQQAFHYHLESYRLYPSDFSVVNWIGSHFIELQIAERAISFFEKAVLNNPNDSYFLLRVAGSYRKINAAKLSGSGRSNGSGQLEHHHQVVNNYINSPNVNSPVDFSYSDPLEADSYQKRPFTSGRRIVESYSDEEIDDELLPM
ncbi:CLUMA_CG011683, isoform A [Clunio marinus]|uniref:CLUMA_CG011683, isoform A n=1 Tax=Clunio marinus TaxID=568069 RepID=A0A1J1IIN9_9DIPT|nr:CLUMA_CG011683, isoform A [Clunio marinus]